MTDRRTAILEAAARTIARRGVRGLRTEELAAEAGVSTALVYYHFKDRAGILRHTLEFITDRAKAHSAGRRRADGPSDARDLLELALLLEFQDLPEVRENSTAWGELRASAVFEPELREALARAGAAWVQLVAELLALARPTASAAHLAAPAEPAPPSAPAASTEPAASSGPAAPIEHPAPAELTASAERLTALREGLNARRLTGILRPDHARELMREAIEVELAHLTARPRPTVSV
ncbi:TetR/AcrR family transcriptional regulator [Streptomyces sp. NPDC017254]|uniref:TetR/AcrR family transcriptional regulator n=1 Tax=unclassified Streptomyces TaxID=2593676 RepID=UPI00378AF26C